MEFQNVQSQVNAALTWSRHSWLTLLAAVSVFCAAVILLLTLAMLQLPTWRSNLAPSTQFFAPQLNPRLEAYPQEFWQTTPRPRPANKTSSTRTPRWILNATPVTVPTNHNIIAIVIDDMGVAEDNSQAMLEAMPKEITLAFLPYGDATRLQANLARMKGHEIIIHQPMQPTPRTREDGTISYGPDTGPNALLRSDTAEDVQHKMALNLRELKDVAVGLNNHMGSHVTSSREHMQTVLNILTEERLFFLDSVTTPRPASRNLKKTAQIPVLERDIFLDHYIDEARIRDFLAKTEAKANKQGYAIAIGHPYPATRRMLEEWIPTLEEKNLTLVPITYILKEKGYTE